MRPRVTITVATRRGRRRLHTFLRAFEDVEGPGAWRPDVRLTPAQLAESRRLAQAARASAAALPIPYLRAMTALTAQRTSTLGLRHNEPLGAGVVHLAPGVDVPGATLALILDALAAAGRASLDLDDLTAVITHLGGRIAALDGLGAEHRRHAEAALYTEIAQRCSSI